MEWKYQTQKMAEMVDKITAEFNIREDDHVRTWLGMELAFQRICNQKLDGAYVSPQEFVLREGQSWASPREYSNYFPTGAPRSCFSNAYQLAAWPELSYVEGFAWCGMLVVPHAWTVTEDGVVIDTTWRWDGEDGDVHRPPREEWQYVGIPFDFEFVTTLLMRQDTYGVIDSWAAGWPLLQEPLPDYARPARWRR